MSFQTGVSVISIYINSLGEEGFFFTTIIVIIIPPNRQGNEILTNYIVF